MRPSYVLGGRAMEIVYSRDGLADYLTRHARDGRAIYLDRFLENAIEVDVDALCDGEEVWIGGIMQHVEEAGIHSGDSACVLPPHSLGHEMLDEIRAATTGIALGLGVVGLMNVQYAVHGGALYVIEANPRASRTVPFVSKAIGVPLAKLACRIMLGERIADLGLPDEPMRADHVSVKEAVLPFDRLEGSDAILGPEMRSTGEVMGIARDFPTAFAKAQAAAGAALPSSGTAFITLTDSDKPAAVGHRADPARPRLPDRRHARHQGGHRAHGHPRHRAQEDRRGLAQRRRLDRERRRRPRGQHADGLGRALGRLADPPRRRSPRGIPCLTTLSGGLAAARAIAAGRQGGGGGALAAGDPRRPRAGRGRGVTAPSRARRRRSAGAP